MTKDPRLAEATAMFRGRKKWDELEAYVKSLNGSLPAGLSAHVTRKMFDACWHSMLHKPWNFLVTPENAAIARAVFVEKKQQRTVWVAVATDANAPGDTLAAQLHEALDALKVLHQNPYAETRDGIDATLLRPRYVEATRTAIAATPDEWNWSVPMIGLLLADGTPESADVLMPMAIKAVAEKGDGLDRLRALADRLGAKTPAIDALKTQLVSVSNARADAKGGANELAAKLGLMARNDFEVTIRFTGHRKNGAQIFEVDAFLDAKDEDFARMSLYWIRGPGRRARMNEYSSKHGEKCFSNFQPLRSMDRLVGWLSDISFKRGCAFKLVQLKSNLGNEDDQQLRAWRAGVKQEKTGSATVRG